MFEKGTSGNPNGRKSGSRNKPKLAKLAQEQAQEQLAALVGKAIEVLTDELDGDNRLQAAKLILTKAVPDVKADDANEPVFLPDLAHPYLSDATRLAIINGAVAEGKITPAQGLVLTRMIETQTKEDGWQGPSDADLAIRRELRALAEGEVAQ